MEAEYYTPNKHNSRPVKESKTQFKHPTKIALWIKLPNINNTQTNKQRRNRKSYQEL